MSSTPFKPKVRLNEPGYYGLNRQPENITEWLAAWEAERKRQNFRGLLNLAHSGLQLPFHRERDGDSVTQLFCHYLAIADGHQSAKNFGHNGPVTEGNDYTAMSHGELMQRLSDKAWMELCNRVFVFSGDEYGEHPKYAWYFRNPTLAEAFISFIDPSRWCDKSTYHAYQANLNQLDKTAYHVKALTFTRTFLAEAWQYREILKREKAFGDLGAEEKAELRSRIEFFRKLKPKLATLMVYYGMAGFLHDRVLDRPTRRVLLDLAFGKTPLRAPAPDRKYKHLRGAYAQLDPSRGYPTLGQREVARILLLYPLVQKGHKDYENQLRKAKRAAKATKTEELKGQLEKITAQLEKLG